MCGGGGGVWEDKKCFMKGREHWRKAENGWTKWEEPGVRAVSARLRLGIKMRSRQMEKR